MTHARRPDWPERLHSLVEKNFGRRHSYGQWDCILFPAGAVKAVTGTDYGRGHRGKYRSPASAMRYLRSIGFDSPEALIDSVLEEKPIGFAQRGDIVLCRTDSGDNPGVCMGEFALVVGVGEETEGLIRVPRDRWLKAWEVGEQHADVPKKRKRRSKAAATSPNAGRPA